MKKSYYFNRAENKAISSIVAFPFVLFTFITIIIIPEITIKIKLLLTILFSTYLLFTYININFFIKHYQELKTMAEKRKYKKEVLKKITIFFILSIIGIIMTLVILNSR